MLVIRVGVDTMTNVIGLPPLVAIIRRTTIEIVVAVKAIAVEIVVTVAVVVPPAVAAHLHLSGVQAEAGAGVALLIRLPGVVISPLALLRVGAGPKPDLPHHCSLSLGYRPVLRLLLVRPMVPVGHSRPATVPEAIIASLNILSKRTVVVLHDRRVRARVVNPLLLLAGQPLVPVPVVGFPVGTTCKAGVKTAITAASHMLAVVVQAAAAVPAVVVAVVLAVVAAPLIPADRVVGPLAVPVGDPHVVVPGLPVLGDTQVDPGLGLVGHIDPITLAAEDESPLLEVRGGVTWLPSWLPSPELRRCLFLNLIWTCTFLWPGNL